MPVAELDLRAKFLRDQLSRIKEAPEDKSLNQVKEEAIISVLSEVAEEARERALSEEIYAVGKTPEEAIAAFGISREWGAITNIRPLEGGDPKYTWGRAFSADGASIKAAGWSVPGGVVLTWWK